MRGARKLGKCGMSSLDVTCLLLFPKKIATASNPGHDMPPSFSNENYHNIQPEVSTLKVCIL
jgi:hypothetical protein